MANVSGPTSTGAVSWDGSSLDVTAIDEVNITQPPEPEPPPDFSWIHPDDGIATSSAQATAGGTLAPPIMPPTPSGTPDVNAVENAKPTYEVKDRDKLNTLDPKFREKAEQLVDKLQEMGWKLRIVWGRRTQEENDELVAQGVASRTSKHLEGKGLDIINRDDPYPNDRNNQFYKDVEAIAKELGLTWGGDFSTRWDPTHVEMP
jgi:hypothetical protein